MISHQSRLNGTLTHTMWISNDTQRLKSIEAHNTSTHTHSLSLNVDFTPIWAPAQPGLAGGQRQEGEERMMLIGIRLFPERCFSSWREYSEMTLTAYVRGTSRKSSNMGHLFSWQMCFRKACLFRMNKSSSVVTFSGNDDVHGRILILFSFNFWQKSVQMVSVKW